MTDDHQCRCGQPAPDSTLCPDCTNTLARALADVPALDSELTTVLARQGKGSSVHVGYVMSSPTRPLPYDPGASAASSELRAVLVAWVRLVAEEQPDPPDLPRNDLTSLARWLLRHVGWLAQHTAGADALGEIFDAVEACRRVAYRQAQPKHFRGPCGQDWQPEDGVEACCLADLYARDERAATVICGQCGAQHEAELLRQRLRDRAGDRLFSRTEMVSLLRVVVDFTVPSRALDTWISSGRVIAHGHLPHATDPDKQVDLYRVEDVLSLVAHEMPTAVCRCGNVIHRTGRAGKPSAYCSEECRKAADAARKRPAAA